MITTITLNPAIDRTMQIEKLQVGQVNRLAGSFESMGGKGINVARVLQSLSVKVSAAGLLGRWNEAQARSLLMRDGLAYEAVLTEGATRQNCKLIETGKQTTTDLNEAGIAFDQACWPELLALVDRLAAVSNYVVFSGSLPPGAPAALYRDLLGRLPSGCRGVLDADGQALLAGLAAKPFLIKPNRQELESALDRPLPSFRDVARAGRDIIDRYGVTMVLVSLGSEGSLLMTAEGALHAAAMPVDVFSTVGAGDAMLAGCLQAIDAGAAAGQVLARATACAAMAVSSAGRQSISLSSVEQLSGQVVLTPIQT